MDPESEAAQRVGTTLCNKWTLERLIGEGGMAAVYVANHKIGRREAIKILHSDVAKDPELRARFEQEAKAVNRFQHPGAVEVRDIDVAEDGSPFLVMELLEGEPLADLARRPGGVALGDLLRWVDEMLDVLAAAHAQGIIHRDIKPDNLFVLHDGRLKVLDFGIARIRDGARAVANQLRTRVGATLGTAPYMPPEQIRGAEIDARADLFAVGATMFRILARRRIHEAETEADLLVKMASTPAPPLSSVAPDVPRDVALVVDRALMFDRTQRYPDALTMQRDVRAVREGQAPPYAAAHAGPPGSPASVTSGASGAITRDVASDAITADAVTRGTRPVLGAEPTMAASPVAIHQAPVSVIAHGAPVAFGAFGAFGASVTPVTQAAPAATVTAAATGAPRPANADAATLRPQAVVLDTMTPPPASIRSPVLEQLQRAREAAAAAAGATAAGIGPASPASQASQGAPQPLPPMDAVTRPAMMVLGAAGLGAPLASTPAGAAAVVVNPAAPPPSQAAPAAPASQVAPPIPSGERTLRSVQGLEAGGAPVAPQGIVMATTVMPQVQITGAAEASPGSRSHGPRTQLSGVAPPAAMAPGESIPVVAAPPAPRRRSLLPGTGVSLIPLVAVGVLFAAIGVGVTLWFMLRSSGPAEPSATAATALPTTTVYPTDPITGLASTAHQLHHPGGGLAPAPPTAPTSKAPPYKHPPR